MPRPVTMPSPLPWPGFGDGRVSQPWTDFSRVEDVEQALVGRVPHAVLDRIDTGGCCDLVDHPLEREVLLALDGRAHAVDPHADEVGRLDLAERRRVDSRSRARSGPCRRPTWSRRARPRRSARPTAGSSAIRPRARPPAGRRADRPGRGRRSGRSGDSRPGTPTMFPVVSRPTWMSASCGNEDVDQTMSSGRIHCTFTGAPTSCERIAASASAPSGPGFDRP